MKYMFSIQVFDVRSAIGSYGTVGHMGAIFVPCKERMVASLPGGSHVKRRGMHDCSLDRLQESRFVLTASRRVTFCRPSMGTSPSTTARFIKQFLIADGVFRCTLSAPWKIETRDGKVISIAAITPIETLVAIFIHFGQYPTSYP